MNVQKSPLIEVPVTAEIISMRKDSILKEQDDDNDDLAMINAEIGRDFVTYFQRVTFSRLEANVNFASLKGLQPLWPSSKLGPAYKVSASAFTSLRPLALCVACKVK